MVVRGSPRNRGAAGEACPDAAEDSPPVIVVYSNGLLVNGAFYDYSCPENRELLQMLRNGEFDKDVLGMSGSHAHAVVEERNEEYHCEQ